jgi:hypothetical protein
MACLRSSSTKGTREDLKQCCNELCSCREAGALATASWLLPSCRGDAREDDLSPNTPVSDSSLLHTPRAEQKSEQRRVAGGSSGAESDLLRPHELALSKPLLLR